MPTASAPLINAIRALEMDAVQQVNFVHPGVPMGMPDIAEVRWRRQLRDNPANPDWPEPNRSVLSNGHGSMPIFTLLHLGSDDVSIDDPQNFHQFVSKTPVHPEVDHPPPESKPPPGRTPLIGRCPAPRRAASGHRSGRRQLLVQVCWTRTVIGIDRFGESAPAGPLFDFIGFTVDDVVNTVKSLL